MASPSRRYCGSCFTQTNSLAFRPCPQCAIAKLCDYCRVITRLPCLTCDNHQRTEVATVAHAEQRKLVTAHLLSLRVLDVFPHELLTIVAAYSADAPQSMWYCGATYGAPSSDEECMSIVYSASAQCGTDCGLAVLNNFATQRPAADRALGSRTVPVGMRS